MKNSFPFSKIDQLVEKMTEHELLSFMDVQLRRRRGIEANPDQISAILNMKSPTCAKEVHIVNGRLASLNKFLSRSTDKCKPFFQVLKKNGALG